MIEAKAGRTGGKIEGGGINVTSHPTSDSAVAVRHRWSREVGWATDGVDGTVSLRGPL